MPLRLVLRLLVLRTVDLSFDLPDDCLVHNVLNVSSALTENKVCSGFENTDNKVTRTRIEPSLGDGDLERGNLSRHNEVLHCCSVTGVELPRVPSRRIGNALPPAPVGHGHEPLGISHMMLMPAVWLEHVRRVWTRNQVVESSGSQNER